ncbi:dopamine D2-like receptor [Artemia franciscana]|uniref:G-protein coupled receptors family 1 profile domain-containing protein n=1 Tax=Artemia franciscana TaxID=6661 RepID=A0AA88H6Z0_ARTSF|nr:hypothetical protein QYM36_016449 [Artemia franciscana]
MVTGGQKRKVARLQGHILRPSRNEKPGRILLRRILPTTISTSVMATTESVIGNSSDIEFDSSGNFYDSLCSNLTLNTSDHNCTLSDSEYIIDKNYWALLLLFLPIFTVFGNLLVILAVFRERSLKSATNYFIVSLAVADCLVAIAAMPFNVYVLVNGDWELPTIICDFYIAMDVICSTSSIFNLVAISIDRYIAITRPLSYARHRDNRRVYLTIVLVWIISIAIGMPITLGLNETDDRKHTLCTFYNADFIIYSSLSSFYIPCIIMVFLYHRIFKAIRKRAKNAVKKQPPSNNKNTTIIENLSRDKSPQLPSTDSHTVMNGNSRNGDDQYEDYDQGVEEDGSDEVQENVPLRISTECIVPTASIVALTTRGLQNPGKDSEASVNQVSGNGASIKNSGQISTSYKNNLWSYLTKTSSEREEEMNSYLPPSYEKSVNQNGPRFTICRARKASRKKREKTSAKRERKATKTLAIVLVVFLACWVPFFTCNIMDAICAKMKKDCSPGIIAFHFTTWLGYINSSLNPVIYTIFNMEFRKAFKRLLYSCE